MGAVFSAGPQALGYMFQARVALAMLLDYPDEAVLKLEALDDIQIEDNGSALKLTLTQLKHHIKKESDLTDHSVDLWKSIRVWSEQVADKSFALSDTKIFLITTASAKANSVATMLGVKDRSVDDALIRLIEVANESSNASLTSSFKAFKDLSTAQQKALLSAIIIVDSTGNIDDYKTIIQKKIRPSVKKQFVNKLFERLEGWWFDKVVLHLLQPKQIPSISAFELNEKIASLAQDFFDDNLPIDYLDLEPDQNYFVDSNKKLFVRQLQELKSKQRIIEKAILDYYRAFNQRSRWLNDGLVSPMELTRFENTLTDEWERYIDSVWDGEILNENELIDIGKGILNWAEFKAVHLRIRPKVDADFIRRGSFHMLADKEPTPAIHWHPLFLEKLNKLITDTVKS